MKTNLSQRRLSDPTLRAIRKARQMRDEAELEFAARCVDALDDGFSYQQVADAALIRNKGTMHHAAAGYRRRLAEQGRRQSKTMPPPADVS